MSRLLVTQTAAQWLCEHHLNCHVGWVQILRVLGPRLLPLAPRGLGGPTAGQEKCRADLHPAAAFLRGLRGAKPCALQHQEQGLSWMEVL